jgi:hypothetical protein
MVIYSLCYIIVLSFSLCNLHRKIVPFLASEEGMIEYLDRGIGEDYLSGDISENGQKGSSDLETVGYVYNRYRLGH